MAALRHLAHAARRVAAAPTTRVAAATLVTGGLAVYAYDSDALARAKTAFGALRAEAAQKYMVHLDAAPPGTVPAENTSRVDAATSVAHPLVLKPASSPELDLVGVGVRTVSFLRMKVYSAGFYVDNYTLKRLGKLPGWAQFQVADLSGPEGVNLVQSVLDAPAACAVNIVPVRNTDFGHLRDGLTRTLLARQKEARKRGELSPEDDERLDAAMQQFKGIFPAGSVPKGRSLTLVRSADGHLSVEYQGKVLGRVSDKWMADNFILAYFDPANPISSALRDSVAQGFSKRLATHT